MESDDVVVNLTARETYFPEKRLFFMEGNEIFTTSPRSRMYSGSGGSGARSSRSSSFSRTPSSVLNTRRIGGAPIGIEVPDDVTIAGPERSRPSELLGAAKVTGQNGPIRYGVLGAFEADPELRGERDDGTAVTVVGDGRNFGVGRILYERSGDSRASVGYIGTLVDHPSVRARVDGVDAHHLSRNGKWRTDVQYMRSDVDGIAGEGVWADVQYTARRGLTHSLTLDYQDDTLDIGDLGFLTRNDHDRRALLHHDVAFGSRLAAALVRRSHLRPLRERRGSARLRRGVHVQQLRVEQRQPHPRHRQLFRAAVGRPRKPRQWRLPGARPTRIGRLLRHGQQQAVQLERAAKRDGRGHREPDAGPQRRFHLQADGPLLAGHGPDAPRAGRLAAVAGQRQLRHLLGGDVAAESGDGLVPERTPTAPIHHAMGGHPRLGAAVLPHPRTRRRAGRDNRGSHRRRRASPSAA